MSIAWLVILILGIIGIIAACAKPKGSEQWRDSTFWFLLSYWVFYLMTMAGPFTKGIALT